MAQLRPPPPPVITDQVLRQKREELKNIKQILEAPGNIAPEQFEFIDVSLQYILLHRNQYLNAAGRGWEGKWIVDEAKRLRNILLFRYDDWNRLLSTLREVNERAEGLETQLNQSLANEPPDNVINIGLHGIGQTMRVPWDPNRLTIVVNRCREADRAIPGSQDTWYANCFFPTPSPGMFRPFWFRRQYQPGAGNDDDIENARFLVYHKHNPRVPHLNHPDDTRGIFFDGPRVHVLSQLWFIRLGTSLLSFACRLAPEANRLQQDLVDIDLQYRQQYRQWTPRERGFRERLYRLRFANILRIRNRILENQLRFNDRYNSFLVDDAGTGGGIVLPD